MTYQVIFHSGSYKAVDAEVGSLEQAQEIRYELTSQMYMAGERDFYYEIKEIKQ